MAKSKRSKKSKNQVIEETLRLRIIVLLVIFVVIIAALKLGFIGAIEPPGWITQVAP